MDTVLVGLIDGIAYLVQVWVIVVVGRIERRKNLATATAPVRRDK